MNKKSVNFCELSLALGIASYPLSIVGFFILFLAALCRIPDAKPGFIVVSIIIYSLAAVLAVTSIILGIIGIKRQSPKKGMAVAGIIVSAIKIPLSVCFIVFPYYLFNMLLYTM